MSKAPAEAGALLKKYNINYFLLYLTAYLLVSF